MATLPLHFFLLLFCARVLCVLRGPWVRVFLRVRVSLAVVIRSTLAPFDCTSHNGVRTMDADPCIVCGQRGGSHERMQLVAGLMLALYAVGIPCLFGFILLRHRTGIQYDQLLRQKGEGDTALTNPYLFLRRRYGKLYSDFKPEYSYWKLVLFFRCVAPVFVPHMCAHA